ncbi:unnamed protein product [Moneuplotes crassus]|uniref:Uncharacterized protein n=1 Tax=Euplotes crassus TaxID=5936 RepID=A0AAD1XWB5_EUPCR|nr:unnamed protein product [Moneuplotes crassus]
MNSLITSNISGTDLDIWDDQLQLLDEVDCSPQMPNATRQFSNTLRYNKGSTRKADFGQFCSNSIQAEGTINLTKQMEPVKGKLKVCKDAALKYHKKAKSQNYVRSSVLDRTPTVPQKIKPAQLRRISSSNILKSLQRQPEGSI